jgi:hypothetical protein
MTLLRPLRPAVLLLTIAAACSGGRTTFEVEVVDGVRQVHNLAAQEEGAPGIHLEFVRQIGGDDRDEATLFFLPLDAVADPEGNLYVLDSRRPAIRKYDRQGRHLIDIGREGSGPGEFDRAITLNYGRDGHLYVSDFRNHRIMVFAPDGSFVGVVNPGQFFHFFRVLSDGRLAALERDRTVTPPPLARIVNPDRSFAATFCRGYDFGEEEMTFMANMASIGIDASDHIYVAFQHYNRIDRYAPDGTLLMRIDRPLNYELQYVMRRSTVEVEGRTVEYPDPLLSFVSVGIEIDGGERIWALTFTAQPDSTGSAPDLMSDHTILQFEVFDSEGVLLCRIPVPAPLSGFRIFGNRLLLIDAYQKACVREYRIVD